MEFIKVANDLGTEHNFKEMFTLSDCGEIMSPLSPDNYNKDY